jgi:hypothetical protein
MLWDTWADGAVAFGWWQAAVIAGETCEEDGVKFLATE